MTIRQRQHLLAYLGYYDGIIDGDWGGRSRAACTAFQRDAGITEDGCGGPETDKALRHAVVNDRLKPEPAEDAAEIYWDEIRFFTREEFQCKCGGTYCDGYPAKMRQEVVRIAEEARVYFGLPTLVVSGLRCREWNRVQGGVENSQHMYGEAADLRIPGVSARRLLNFLQTKPIRYAYAINETNVHFDVEKGVR